MHEEDEKAVWEAFDRLERYTRVRTPYEQRLVRRLRSKLEHLESLRTPRTFREHLEKRLRGL
jgi:hypothetical protein